MYRGVGKVQIAIAKNKTRTYLNTQAASFCFWLKNVKPAPLRLPDKGSYSLPVDGSAIDIHHMCYIHVHSGILRLPIDGSVPARTSLAGRKYQLPPTVVQLEKIQLCNANKQRPQHIIVPVGVGCKTRRHRDVGTYFENSTSLPC